MKKTIILLSSFIICMTIFFSFNISDINKANAFSSNIMYMFADYNDSSDFFDIVDNELMRETKSIYPLLSTSDNYGHDSVSVYAFTSAILPIFATDIFTLSFETSYTMPNPFDNNLNNVSLQAEIEGGGRPTLAYYKFFNFETNKNIYYVFFDGITADTNLQFGLYLSGFWQTAQLTNVQLSVNQLVTYNLNYWVDDLNTIYNQLVYDNVIKYAPIDTDLYQQGYNAGYSQGYNVGINDSSNYMDGYDEGWYQGELSGYNSGYSDGYINGYSEGIDSGHASGYNEGYLVGINTALDELGITAFIPNILGSYVNFLFILGDFKVLGISVLDIVLIFATIAITKLLLKMLL